MCSTRPSSLASGTWTRMSSPRGLSGESGRDVRGDYYFIYTWKYLTVLGSVCKVSFELSKHRTFDAVSDMFFPPYTVLAYSRVLCRYVYIRIYTRNESSDICTIYISAYQHRNHIGIDYCTINSSFCSFVGIV